MGYSTRLQGSGAQPSQQMGYYGGGQQIMGSSQPMAPQPMTSQNAAQQAPAYAHQPGLRPNVGLPPQPQLAGMPGFVRQPQQGQLAMPPRPPMSTYSTPGATNGMQVGQMPQANAQPGMGVNTANRYANALSRM